MQLIFEALDAGATAFVALGYLSVKQGKIIGHRVTSVTDKPEVEYLVQWFGAGDRPEEKEWFEARKVHQTAEAAFEH